MSFDADGKLSYSYLNDGEVLRLKGESAPSAISAYTGKVKDFTTELSMENSLTFTPSAGEEVDTAVLAGKYVYVDNDKNDNGAYRIESASRDGDDIVLGLGKVSVIRSYADPDDMSKGYIYNIEKGQSLRIPLTTVYTA